MSLSEIYLNKTKVMKLKCKFFDFKWDGKVPKYTCFVNYAWIIKPNVVIEEITGEHIDGRSNEHVEAIWFRKALLEFFPQGLGKVFPALKYFQIENCRLKKISCQDLIGLERLEYFYLPMNELTSVPSDLFILMPNLKKISFYRNKLQVVGSKLMQRIAPNLIYADFGENTSINAFFNPHPIDGQIPEVSIEKLMEKIDQQCETPSSDDKTLVNVDYKDDACAGIQSLWNTKKLADFTIVASDGVEFKVHKNILAAQSPVFAAVFDSHLSEDQENRMTIPDFGGDVVEEFLRFFYFGSSASELSMELFAISAKYDVPKLNSLCLSFLLDNMDESNAYEIYCLGCIYFNKEIEEKALDMIKKMLLDLDEEMGHNQLVLILKYPEFFKTMMQKLRDHDRALNDPLTESATID